MNQKDFDKAIVKLLKEAQARADREAKPKRKLKYTTTRVRYTIVREHRRRLPAKR